jgi:hypothetical protein
MPATKAQRLKHLPTGLYFIPSRMIEIKIKRNDGIEVSTHVKSNLSKTGKVYVRGATLKFLEQGFYSHIEAQKLMQIEANMKGINLFCGWRKRCLSKFVPDDWQIEDFNN